MEAFITGIGWVTAAGLGRGREGRFSWGEGELPAISRKDIFADPRPHFGRMDRFSKFGLAGVAMALRDAGVESGANQTIGVIASTLRGCNDTDNLYLRTVQEMGAQFASPHLFVFVSGNTFLGEASIAFGLRGPTFLLSEQDLSGRTVLSTAIEMIVTNQSDAMVAGMCDIVPPDSGASNGSVSRQGALFFVLQKGSTKERTYGTLELNKQHLFFEKMPVDDISWLAARLSGR